MKLKVSKSRKQNTKVSHTQKPNEIVHFWPASKKGLKKYLTSVPLKWLPAHFYECYVFPLKKRERKKVKSVKFDVVKTVNGKKSFGFPNVK